jgi:hypothetical protein
LADIRKKDIIIFGIFVFMMFILNIVQNYVVGYKEIIKKPGAGIKKILIKLEYS